MPESIKPVCKDRLELRVGISAELERKIQRVRDILSQKTSSAAFLESSLQAMVETYLEKHDPVRRAERLVARPGKSSAKQRKGRQPIPASISHQVVLRDRNRCTQIDSQGKRCPEMKWIALHHKRPVSQGGQNTVDNLTTLCSHHHQRLHRLLHQVQWRPRPLPHHQSPPAVQVQQRHW